MLLGKRFHPLLLLLDSRFLFSLEFLDELGHLFLSFIRVLILNLAAYLLFHLLHLVLVLLDQLGSLVLLFLLNVLAHLLDLLGV